MIIGRSLNDSYINVSGGLQILGRAIAKLNRVTSTQLIDPMTISNIHMGTHRVDVLHLFNSVSFSRTPWVSTFETVLPRFSIVNKKARDTPQELRSERLTNMAMKAFSGAACKKLLAMSRNNLEQQKALLSVFPEIQEQILPKLEVAYPPQKIMIRSLLEKSFSRDDLTFMFVGASFHRKGGVEILETLQKMREQFGHRIKLIVVSGVIIDNYATGETLEDTVAMKGLLQQNNSWVEYYSSLPNDEVLSLMRRADVGLLPTYADTFGFSVLEFQACGCPVISTNVRALPEVNDDNRGWMIQVPKDKAGEGLHGTRDGRMSISRAIRDGLERSVIEIIQNRSLLPIKAENALKSLEENHDPDSYAENLSRIYASAVG